MTRTNKILLTIFILSVLNMNVNAVIPPSEEWDRILDPREGYIVSAQQTLDGGYITASNVWAIVNNKWNKISLIIRTDTSGNERWKRTFVGDDEVIVQHIRQTSDGGHIFAGWIYKEVMYNDIKLFRPYGWLVKIDDNGGEEWNKTFGSPLSYDGINYVVQTTDNGYILSGNVDGEWLVKTDSEGNKEWGRRFAIPGYGYMSSVMQTSDQGYISSGIRWDGNNYYALVVKTDDNGNEQWNKTFEAEGDVGIVSPIIQTLDRGYIFTEIYTPHDTYATDSKIVKIDNDGNEQWNRTFSGSHHDRLISVQMTKDGGYVLAGSTISSEYGISDNNEGAWLVKVDDNGNEQWNETFGIGGTISAFNYAQQTIDEGYIAVGGINYRPWLVKIYGEDIGDMKTCKCEKITIVPKTSMSGKTIILDGAIVTGDKNQSTEPVSWDAIIDINWDITIKCTEGDGECSADLEPTKPTSTWDVGNKGGTVLSESHTAVDGSATIKCKAPCGQEQKTTVMTTYKATIQKGTGSQGDITGTVTGNIELGMKSKNPDCPGEWKMRLKYVANTKKDTAVIDPAGSDYDGDGRANNADKYPLDPSRYK